MKYLIALMSLRGGRAGNLNRAIYAPVIFLGLTIVAFTAGAKHFPWLVGPLVLAWCEAPIWLGLRWWWNRRPGRAQYIFFRLRGLPGEFAMSPWRTGLKFGLPIMAFGLYLWLLWPISWQLLLGLALAGVGVTLYARESRG